MIMDDIGYAPLRYYWLIECENGDAVAQFDPESGQENLWGNVPKEGMVKVSLAEFSPELSETIIDGCGVHTVSSPFPDIFSIDLKPGDTLILLRRNYVSYSSAGLQNRRTAFILGKNGVIIYAL